MRDLPALVRVQIPRGQAQPAAGPQLGDAMVDAPGGGLQPAGGAVVLQRGRRRRRCLLLEPCRWREVGPAHCTAPAALTTTAEPFVEDVVPAAYGWQLMLPPVTMLQMT